MMRTVSLSDICTKITSGGTPLTKRDDYYGGGIPWLRTQEVNFGNIYSTEKTITELGLKNSSAKIIPKDSVIVAMYGATAGKSAINKIPLATNQACCNLIIDNNKADYRFVYYYLVNSYEKLLSVAVGAAQQNLGSKQISAMTINLPSLSQQKKIANILGSLDEKIELNRRMNETLEQLGQALFRHYFVDNPEAVGWKSGTLGDIIVNFDSKRKPLSSRQRAKMQGDYRYFGATSVMDHVNDYLFDGTYLLLAEDGSVMRSDGTPYLQYVWGRFWVNNHAHIIQAKYPFTVEYLYLLLAKTNVQSLVSGAVQLKINQKAMNSLVISIPPDDLVIKFCNLVNSLFAQYRENEEQIELLVNLRDSLLPKLISGEIEV